ncbi:MAG: hypothetical protein WAT39_13510 [Planctomycetota bacterium]
MSPIGRVFIVLNLALAGGFIVFSGTHLQKQHNYKSALQKEQTDRAAEKKASDEQIAKLESERNQFENAKTANETQLGEARNANARLTDDNKKLALQLASMEGDMKQLLSTAQAANTEMKAAFATAKQAYDTAIADQKVKDEAVNARVAAEAENRQLKTTIAEMTDTVAKRDAAIAQLDSDKKGLELLVKVAETNGFVRAMAAPNLAGMVTNASGRLCTIQITDNPGNIDIKEAIERGKWGFAIYDASGYKGEAIAERYEASANAVLCKTFPVKGEIKVNDKAATKTP